MSSAHLPTDVLLLRLRCQQPDLATLAQGLAAAPICLELQTELCRSAWSAPSSTAYLYLRLPHQTALSLSTLAPQFNGVSRSTQLKVSRLALMTDIPGASHGQKANFHYAVEMTPEASWEVELQHWYDSEHLPGLLNDAAFEFDAHIPHALKAGFAQNKIDALREHTISDLFTEEERLLLELTDRMTRDVKVPEELMARVSARREPGEVVELVATVAAYNMVSRFLVALNISH